ncbi:MAG: hypothetical protein RTV72_16040 [Candidatus Thorarchaeota archaeon]
MEWRRIIAVIIVVLISSSVLVIGIVNLNNQGDEVPAIYEFEWPVEVGDEFTFRIGVTGATYVNWQIDGPPPYVEFNDAIIRAEVIYLPTNTTSLDNATLLTEIIFPIKFNCTFENSSSIPEPIRSRLTELLSWTLVPKDKWDLLNTSFYENRFLFPQAYVNEKICSTTLDESSLHISIVMQKDWLHAAAEKWKGAISLATGLPYLMTYQDYYYSCIGWGDSVTLSLNYIE